MSCSEVLRVERLDIGVRHRGGSRALVHGVDLALRAGERVALVGESGSGKTLTALTLLRLNPAPTEITGGRVLLHGTDLLAARERELERIRGARLAMIYQDPFTCLNPVRTIGSQLTEAIRAHEPLPLARARARAVELLGEVGLAEPASRIGDYPHQFSGGMRQRVMIAMAICREPEVLIADEPTTALDVTTQDRILRLLDTLARRHGMAVLLITHDLAVASAFCQRIEVMRAGRIVESGALPGALSAPAHAYTRQLLDSAITLDTTPAAPEITEGTPLLEATGLSKVFGTGTRAVDGVSLTIRRGETLGLVGESGSGKSTLGQLLLGLDTPSAGQVRYAGMPLEQRTGARHRRMRRDLQVVLQDPVGSLNRRKTVEQILGLPLRVHTRMSEPQRRRRVAELLDLVGLPGTMGSRYPRELSGGQCQRVNIARAIAPSPSFLVLDEAVSAVDVVTRAQILDLLRRLRRQLGLTYLFVSHDLAVVRHLAPRIAVMHRGRIVESGSRERIFAEPEHACTRALLAAVPRLEVSR
ncbi:dipeptide ABC transporter ATP-binding protein [Amycolatopsis aidingensis]|uniref:dipeptide ABC transporter ATP-binding protein n=1 Tax=Amycolatopsis aidingensis TaxID=2842453 RepID=UPI001C0E3917|nr:ABC transporter ATP-binding protein [Amycolatopsis aidingensis]